MQNKELRGGEYLEKGIIVKALSGFYYVENKKTKEVLQCRSRGLFRKNKITPLVGDHVQYLVEADNDGYVMKVEPRHNELVRPPIANVDVALVVFSAKEPDFNVKLLDRFLAMIEAKFIEAIIIVTKIDLLTEEAYRQLQPILDYYRKIGYKIFETSSTEGQGMNDLNQFIHNQIIVICGQSGVGKSSLLNRLDSSLELEVNEISKALGRGKHTTRHVELHKLNGALVADTPGFSSLDLEQLDIEDLAESFVEFRERAQECKFRGCIHENEPRCAVKVAVDSGEFRRSRYDNYLVFLNEIKTRKTKY